MNFRQSAINLALLAYARLYDKGQPGLRAAEDALGGLAALTRADGAALLAAILPELHQIEGARAKGREQEVARGGRPPHLARLRVVGRQ